LHWRFWNDTALRGADVLLVQGLRPMFQSVEESQGKYSSHQIDAIKGIEAVKAPRPNRSSAKRC
jgi:hypothetical protein